ncbi:MAG: hypothetical protein IKC22_05540 [Bacilli bacterium]|nr:hypothetical protein [Bacilli bacterium]
MKRISFLITLLFILLTSTVRIYAKTISTINLEELNVHISGTSVSVIELSFETEEPLFNLNIWINYDKSGIKSKDLIYGERQEPNPRCEVISRGDLQENNKYLYRFKFTSTEKISTFDFVFKYELDGNEISQKIYVTNGNPNIDDDVFSIGNAIIIGLISSLAAGIGTYIIIRLSEKNAQVTDED